MFNIDYIKDFSDYKYKYKTLKVMFDFSSSHLWADIGNSPYGGMMELESIRIDKRTQKLFKEFDNLMYKSYDKSSFKYYEYSTNIMFEKNLLKNYKFLKAEKIQLKIAKLLKRQFRNKNILIFSYFQLILNKRNYLVKI